MSVSLFHEDADITIHDHERGHKRVTVTPKRADTYIHTDCCETSYPLPLLELVLRVKGPGYMCDEIMRDEDPSYVQEKLGMLIVAHVPVSQVTGTRVLDFGCGSGASTLALARLFPHAEIVGVELNADLLAIAQARLDFHGLKNVRFHLSASGTELPADLGQFDFIMLSAVYEHLLPKERTTTFPSLWGKLKPGGLLFIEDTPFRYFPIEHHTTGGLPFLNYLPDRMAGYVARRFSRKVDPHTSWESLLREGIRGGSEGEIVRILESTGDGNVTLLEPTRLGLRDRVDLWYVMYAGEQASPLRKLMYLSLKVIKGLVGVNCVPYLALAIRKDPTGAR
jgi:2-polyprenyl-3-methyl-5-hydroxy-6-metoxy-1,4-benzoquinol methylase